MRVAEGLPCRLAESFFASLKTELIDRHRWPTHRAAAAAVFDYIEGWYNTRRRHSTLGYLSPAAFELTATTATTAAEQVA